MQIRIKSAAAAANAALYVAILLFLLQRLLLAAAVRHRVPDDEKCCCGSLHLIPVFPSSLFNTFFFNVALGSAVAFSASFFISKIHNTKYSR